MGGTGYFNVCSYEPERFNCIPRSSTISISLFISVVLSYDFCYSPLFLELWLLHYLTIVVVSCFLNTM